MMQNKNNRKHRGVVGAIANLLAESTKTRQRVQGRHTTKGTPMKLSGSDWKAVLVGTKDALSQKNLPTLAAAVAYYSTLAFFPFLAATVAIAALLISSDQLDALIGATEVYLPSDISSVVASQLQNLVSRRVDNFLAAVIALALALFSASGASRSLVTASNVAYEVRESRGWLTQQLWGIIWTMAGIVFGAIIVALLAVNQTLLNHLDIPGVVSAAILYGRWFVLFLFSVFGLSVFYTFGPNRPRVRWQWVSWGAIIATIAWLVTTWLFFAYVQYFANYTQSYSLFAGIIALMIWMNLSALSALLGAEINHQLEVTGHKKWGGFLHHIH